MKYFLVLLAALAASSHAADLTIRVEHIDKAAGQITVALYDSAGSWLKQPARSASAAATIDGATLVFKDLPPGDYAFSVLHDANGNGRMDRNLFGIPSEKYAFSNNAVGKMGPASYADARFSLPAAGAALTVQLH